MSTKYEFNNEAIENFCNNNGVTITLTVEQLNSLGTNGTTPLLIEQISGAADQLCPDDESLRNFLEKMSVEFHPVALSLYVLNDDLWKMMSRKHEHPERMLPMTTIPWFYWEKDAESRKNPSGIQRFVDSRYPFTIKVDRESLAFSGSGGDFAGLLEGRIADQRKGIRPLFIPGETGPKKIVARYESQLIQVRINIQSIQIALYPNPLKELDYFYSEHPRVFYDHGIQLVSQGEDVSLKVGKRKEAKLRGDVIILIGKSFKDISDSEEILRFHVWLNILSRIPFL